MAELIDLAARRPKPPMTVEVERVYAATLRLVNASSDPVTVALNIAVGLAYAARNSRGCSIDEILAIVESLIGQLDDQERAYHAGQQDAGDPPAPTPGAA